MPVLPDPLKPGDTVGFVAPAGVPDESVVARAKSRFESLGYAVKVYGDLFTRYGYLAGEDSARAQAVMDAFVDPDCRAVLPIRGGYGCTRIVDKLDYEKIRANPKWFVGYSDNTALHSALWKECQLITLHGPHPIDGVGREPRWPAEAEESYWRALTEGCTGQLNRATSATNLTGVGTATGRLVGGNLSLICALLGTPYEIDARGNILLVEDVDERPFRIDRLFSQLRHAGVLNSISGMIVGHFTNCVAADGEPSLALETILAGYLEPLGIPVISGFPSGHEAMNLTLPLGARCTLDADRRTLAFDGP